MAGLQESLVGKGLMPISNHPHSNAQEMEAPVDEGFLDSNHTFSALGAL